MGMLVDARDVAEAEIRLAESKDIQAEDIGHRVMELFPNYDCATTVKAGAAGKVVRNETFWIRVNMRNDKVCKATGMLFCTFDDTFKNMVETLVHVGGIKPKMKA